MCTEKSLSRKGEYTMKNRKKDCLAVYLLWAFGIAWILQIAAGMMFRAGAGLAYSALLAVSMFAPLLAAVCPEQVSKEWAGSPVLKETSAGSWAPGLVRLLGGPWVPPCIS